MKTLLIDTSTERGVVAISHGEDILYHKELPHGLQNSSYLLPAIEEGLRLLNIVVEQLGCIIAGVGPGSYTGMRVCAATAKALSYPYRIPLVGISSLHGFIPDTDGPFTAIIDAKIGGAYFLHGERHNSSNTYSNTPTLSPLHTLQPRGILVTPKIFPLPNSNLLWLEKAPDPKHMITLGLQIFQQHDYSTDGKLELLYLRKTQAEIEKFKRTSSP